MTQPLDALDTLDGGIPNLESHLRALEAALDDFAEVRRLTRGFDAATGQTSPEVGQWGYTLHKFADGVHEPAQQDALAAAGEVGKDLEEKPNWKKARRRAVASRDVEVQASFPQKQQSQSFSSQDKLIPPHWFFDDVPPTRVITQYLSSFVRSSKSHPDAPRVRLWLPAGSHNLTRPSGLHVMVDKVLQAFVMLRYSSQSPSAALFVEKIVCMAPHEAKPPHASSEFLVYQATSRYMSALVLMEPSIQIDAVLELLATYRTLFMDKCGLCGMELSAEDYLPPVGRTWKLTTGPEKSAWQARHIQCMGGLV